MTLVNENDFPAIVEMYNTEGKKATYEYIRETYAIKNPRCLMMRISRDRRFKYDSAADKYVFDDKSPDESLFMSIDDLCGSRKNKPSTSIAKTAVATPVSMEQLVHELISDRLLELNRYVKLEASSHTILIDRTSMIADGYKVVTQ
ncbi:MAG: hypothetical protein IJ821_04890 [Lachnospiraceae bacterium]|nr:hypothetical protein [Lachnospiraceae bacterium]